MKLLIVALFACVAVAMANPELKWSEDGQYRLVDTFPGYRLVAEPGKYRYIDGLPLTYRSLYSPMMLGLRDYEPFVYNYKQVDSKI